MSEIISENQIIFMESKKFCLVSSPNLKSKKPPKYSSKAGTFQGQGARFSQHWFQSGNEATKKKQSKEELIRPAENDQSKAVLPPLTVLTYAALQFFSIWRAHELWQFWPCSPLISSWQAWSSQDKHCCKKWIRANFAVHYRFSWNVCYS